MAFVVLRLEWQLITLFCVLKQNMASCYQLPFKKNANHNKCHDGTRLLSDGSALLTSYMSEDVPTHVGTGDNWLACCTYC